MRVLLTGARGFAGTWLIRELEEAGHETVGPGHDDLDVTDQSSIERALRDARPDAVAHLAAVSFGPAAARDPAQALRVTVGGTIALFEALRATGLMPVVLVSGSSDVYGRPDPARLPLDETAPLAPVTPYALTKAAQEAVALAAANQQGLPVVVTRSFNHSGPGQRPEFVIPALASRVRAAADGRATSVPVGNLDVRRDFTDVRDVVRAYRLLLESAEASRVAGGLVVNIASGRSVTIREVAEAFRRLAGNEAPLVVDPELVRTGEPPEIRGDASLVARLIGWRSTRPLDETLRDVWDSLPLASDEE